MHVHCQDKRESAFLLCKDCCYLCSSGDLSRYVIDLYSFLPGVHTLTIVFNLTTGEEGTHLYNFTASIREHELQNLSTVYVWHEINNYA